jgi:hypothetical protein
VAVSVKRVSVADCCGKPKKASAWVVSGGGGLYNQADFFPAVDVISGAYYFSSAVLQAQCADVARILKKAYKSVVRQTYDQN